jgi:hypothetical protein
MKPDSKVEKYLITWPKILLVEFYERRYALLIGFVILVTMLCGTRILQHLTTAEFQPDPAAYADVATYLETHSNVGDVVAYQDFATYTRLVFFNTKNRFPIGIDPAFTYANNKEVFWVWYHITLQEEVCTEEVCTPENKIDVYEGLKNVLKARYFIMDYVVDPYVFVQYASTTQRVESDSRFELVYGTSEPGQVVIYELK